MYETEGGGMAQQKTILVTGATGAQGGSVAAHLATRGTFRVRCLTRKPDSPRARALAGTGIEVVKGDLKEPATLAGALKGCSGVFGVTNFWEHFGGEYELGKNLVDAVAASGIEHFVFSTLPGVQKISHGALEAPHFDIKARLEQYSRGLALPATYVHVAFYYENFLSFFPPRPAADGSLSFGFPQGDVPLATVAAEDVGGVVAPLFERRSEFLGRVVGIAGDEVPPESYAATMSRILGRRVVYEHVPRETFAALPFAGAEDLANMFEFNRRFVPSRRAEIEECRTLYPELLTFDQWLTANSERFRSALMGGMGAAGA
jgi:uncharacterized protein YbjT (DUF2867 family)